MKLCKKCNKIKDLKFFHKNRSCKDRLHQWCKSCRKNETLKYLNKYFPNRSIGKPGRKQFKTELEKKQSRKDWIEKNKEKIKLDKHNDYLKNKEKYLKYSKRWKLKNKKRVNEIIKKYRSSNGGRINRQINGNTRRALRISVDDKTITRQAISKLYILQKGLCAISGKKLNYKFHIDHIKPLSKGGTHSINNVQLVLPVENLKKGNKWDK